MPIYLYSSLDSAVAARAPGVVSAAEKLQLHNQAVREVLSLSDLRSAKRRASLAPNLFDDTYDYGAPSDLKGAAIIDIKPQVGRSVSYEFDLTTEEEFDRLKDTAEGLIALSDNSFTRKLKISADIDDDAIVVSPLDSITSSGTWTAFGDGTNLTTDSDNYVKGSGSINWDISAAGGTTAGIVASDLTTFDITDYVANASVFVWVYITSATNLTNFIIRIGSSSSNYYTKTITTTNESASFAAGWNLLRFDFITSTQTGTVDLDACNYCAIYMTKAAGKISETDYRFDHIVIRQGEYHDVIYYSKYGWQTSAGVWLENSTATDDKLNVDTEEMQLIVEKSLELHLQNLEKWQQAEYARGRFNAMLADYKMKYPSEAKLLIASY